MNAYRPQAADIGFILFDVLQAQDRLAQLPALADNADPDLLRQVLEEAGKFVGEVVAPLGPVQAGVGEAPARARRAGLQAATGWR